jgi:hypothetical protein
MFPVAPRYTFQQDSFWLPRWRVTFADGTEVEVVDSSGAVSRYTSSALGNVVPHVKLPGGAPLSKAAVLKIANKVLAAAGPMDSVAPAAPTYQQVSSISDTESASWYVSYKRMYKGIPYHRDQQVIVILQAQTGSVLGYNLVFPSPPPANGPATMSSDQAIAVANAQIARADLNEPIFRSCNQLVVQPNTCWLAPGPAKTQFNCASRIVWDCAYKSGVKTCDVWIDTETGNTIGGEIIQSK